MKVALISNFLNHHQMPLASAFLKLGCQYHFIATESIPESRILLGYDSGVNQKDYVIRAYENRKEAEEIIRASDVVISSWDGRAFLKETKGLVFIYTERIFKQTDSRVIYWMKNIRRYIKFKYYTNRYTDKGTKYLCIGEYAVKDYIRIGVKKKQIYKFAYFPELSHKKADREYTRDMAVKCLWVGRLIKWKRPEDAVSVVAKLFKEGFSIELNIIGRGPEEEKLKKMVALYNAETYISFTGALSFETIREYMNASDIFLFTSTEGEGWGVVLNEAMSEGMAVVASDGAGATTYLVKDKVNGEVFPSGKTDILYLKLKKLLENQELIKEYGEQARKTMEQCWNAGQAAKNFVHLVHCLQQNLNFDVSEGPLSPV